MIERTDEEIVEHLKEWDEYGVYSCNDTIEIIRDKGRVIIKLSATYEAPVQPTYQFLKYIDGFFGTSNININNEFALTGCCTCDYGSSYGFDLIISNEDQ